MTLLRCGLTLSCCVLLLLLLASTTTNALLLLPPAVVHTVAGAIAGSTGAVAAYPIDYVKSQLQTDYGRAKYQDGVHAAVDIVRQSGPLALYRGVLVNVVGIAPEKTIKLSANDMMRVAVRAHFGGQLPVVGEVVAGAFAGMTQVVVTNPLEVIKLRLQTSDMTIQDVMKQIKGLADLYEGAGACVMRDVVFSAVLFPVYSHAKVAMQAALLGVLAYMHGADPAMMMNNGGNDAALMFWANMLAGSMAAAPAAFILTPADVIKTRLQQARKQEDSEDDDVKKYDSFLHAGSEIINEEGPQVLFSGALERVVRSVPQFGVTLAVFDVVTSFAINHGLMLPEV